MRKSVTELTEQQLTSRGNNAAFGMAIAERKVEELKQKLVEAKGQLRNHQQAWRAVCDETQRCYWAKRKAGENKT